MKAYNQRIIDRAIDAAEKSGESVDTVLAEYGKLTKAEKDEAKARKQERDKKK